MKRAMAALALGVILSGCGERSATGVSAPIGSDAPLKLCTRLGFVAGTPELATCLARIDGLARQQTANQSQCEGIRQRALAPRFPAIGTGSTVANADADYQSCMSGLFIPPAQLELPSSRTTSCHISGMEIACD